MTSSSVRAQDKLARINDPDGYTNLRAQAGPTAAIITRINKGELFYCAPSDSLWWKVQLVRYFERKPVTGYVHRSRIEVIERLALDEQHQFFLSILDSERRSIERFEQTLGTIPPTSYDSQKQQWVSRFDSARQMRAMVEKETYDENYYSPVLTDLPRYFCQTADTVVLLELMHAMTEDHGSANEQPDFTLGDCFVCQPEAVLHALTYMPFDDREALFESLDQGLDEAAYGIPDSTKHFDHLRSILAQGRKQFLRH